MEPGKEQSVKLLISVSSGAGTGTLTNEWAIIRWLRIQPVAESDTYDVTIKDADGIIMLSRTNMEGTFSERLEMSLGIMRTIEISSASQDGTYTCVLDLH